MVQIIVEIDEKLSKLYPLKVKRLICKTEHNNSVCVFEFKLFVHCSITFTILKKNVILFLAHPIL